MHKRAKIGRYIKILNITNNMKIAQKQHKNNIYNLYAVFMAPFVSALTGFGFFWMNQLIGFYNVFLNIFLGMMISALMFDTIKLMYPYKK